MKITEKQLQLMFQILVDSIKVDISRIFTLDYDTRHRLYMAIIGQQSDIVIEINNNISERWMIDDCN